MRSFLFCLLLPGFLLAQSTSKPVVLSDEAKAIQREALLIDGHNDLPWQYREKKDLSFQSIDIRRPQKALHTDIPRLRERRRRRAVHRPRSCPSLHSQGWLFGEK